MYIYTVNAPLLINVILDFNIEKNIGNNIYISYNERKCKVRMFPTFLNLLINVYTSIFAN